MYRIVACVAASLQIRKEVNKNDVRNIEPLPDVCAVESTPPLLQTTTHTRTEGEKEIYDVSELYGILSRLFSVFSRQDILQPSGRGNLNTGEVALVGVTTIIDCLGLKEQDVFGDIGSGIGSVLAQVALQTDVGACVGLEIREELAEKSKYIMASAIEELPRLSVVKIISGDIRNWAAYQHLLSCTVIFSNNKVFDPQSCLGLQDFICSSSSLRKIILGNKLCHRCRRGCMKEFCQLWEIETTIDVAVCWTAGLEQMYVYRRRRFDELLALIESM